MDTADALINIFNNIDIFMLIFARIIAFFSIVPIIGGSTTPNIIKIGASLSITTIIYTYGFASEDIYYASVFAYFMLLAKEVIVGLIIALVVYFIFNSTYVGGQFTDQQMGYSMSSVYDPMTNSQVPITGNMYYFALCAIFIANKGHHSLISSLVYSYKALPIGEAVLIPNSYIFYNFLYNLTEFFKMGVIISIPIIGVILVTDIALGVMVRAVPKMNVFVVGMPLKALIGLISFWIILPMFSQVFYNIYEFVIEQVLNIIKVMMQ